MFSQIHHLSGRRLLLLAAFLSGVSWNGIAHAQASAADIAAAKVKLARAERDLAKAELEQLQVGGKVSAPTEPPARKIAAAVTTPKTTPAPGSSKDAGDADEETASQDGTKAPKAEPEKTEKDKAVAKGRQDFGGLEFGVGISFTLDVGSNDRVTEAELVNGLVRVKDEDNGRARIMLESHYFFKPCQGADGKPLPKSACSLPFGMTGGDFGWGPFIALQPGTDNIIEAVAIGGMVGFRRPGEGTESFNLGLGLVIDPNTRILGDGIVANQPLPVGETAIRYKEKMQTGALLLASFGF